MLRKDCLRENELYHLTGSVEGKNVSAVSKKDYNFRIKNLRWQARTDQIDCSDNKSKTQAVINKERRIKVSVSV